jgi:multiple sugar transport system ATP-binding protein
MLEVNSLTAEFDGTFAVNNLNISCKQGEFLVIFGPAGAGKSTTLRLIAGILKPTAGQISFGGKNLNDVAPEHRNMSMVFENYALYSHLSVFDNIAFPLRAKKKSADEINRRVWEMAETLQIQPLLDRRPGFLSGGQRQRVALGRAMVREADVYLLDEPISHLDAKLRHRMRGQLKAMCSEREATVIHVTHDYREAMALSDRIAILNQGKLMQLGTPAEVFNQPANEFVASFFGDPPMNFIDVDYRAENGPGVFSSTRYDFTIASSPQIAKALQQFERSDTIRIGVRSNAITVESEIGDSQGIPAKVLSVETLGFRNILIAEVGESQIRVILPSGCTYQYGSTIKLNLDHDNLHVFVNEEAVYHPVSSQN